MRYYFLGLLSFLFMISSLQAQEFTLSGFIKDTENGEDLIGATVQVDSLGIGTTTNAYGFFSLKLPAGQHQLLISYLGYTASQEKIEITADRQLNVKLNPETAQLEAVTVSATAANEQITNPQMGVERLTVAKLQKIPVVLGEVDVLKSLLLLPGVSNVSEGSTSFNVRGGSADQNLILLDEANIYNASHLLGLFSVFNADAIKEVKLYKGGIPAKYGGRLSSVLEVRQRDGNKQGFAGSAGVGLTASRLNLEGPIAKKGREEGKGSWLIAGRRSYADVFLNLTNEFQDDVLYFYDLNAKVNYAFGEKDRIFLSAYLGRDRLEVGSLIGNDWGNQSFTARWNHLYSNRLFGNLSFTASRYDYTLKNFRPGTSFERIADIRNLSLRKDVNFFVNNQHQFNFGAEGTYTAYQPGKIRAINDTPIEPTTFSRQYSLELAGYVSHNYKPADWLEINYGLRYSIFYRLGAGTIRQYENDQPVVQDETGTYLPGEVIGEKQYGKGEVISTFDGLSPRVSVRLTTGSNSSVKLGYHRMYQYLHLISNTTSASPLDIWLPSGPFKDPQRADQFSVGYFRNLLNNQLEFSIEGYYKRMDRLTDFIDGAQLLFTEHLETQLARGKGRAYGLEFQLKKNKGRLTGWLSYTLSRSERQITGVNQGKYYPTNFDKTHDLSLTGIYELTKRLTLSTNFVYATGQPVTYPSGKYEYSGLLVANYSQRNGDRLPDYHRLDLSVTLKNKPKPRTQSQWVFSLYNVYNRQNASNISFRERDENASGQEAATGITEAVQLSFFGVIPGVTYEIKF